MWVNATEKTDNWLAVLAFKNSAVLLQFRAGAQLSVKNPVIHESDVRSIFDKIFDWQDKLLDMDVVPHPCITRLHVEQLPVIESCHSYIIVTEQLLETSCVKQLHQSLNFICNPNQNSLKLQVSIEEVKNPGVLVLFGSMSL